MKNNYQFIFSILFIFLLSPTISEGQSITLLQQNKLTSIRGLSIVNDKTAWISGSNGYIAITNDAGTTWEWQQIKGYEKSEFRDIEAFSDKEAVIMSSGTPALVLKTIDGGKSWQEKYIKTDSAYFFDAIDFIGDRHGYILGDPIKNRFLIMETKNGGETWEEIKNAPNALPGEAAFAASGTCLRLSKNGTICIVSGGRSSRMIILSPNDNKWKYADLPIVHGKSSEGAFSLAIEKNTGIIVGGDYAIDTKTDFTTALYTIQPYLKFSVPLKSPEGFQSCVEHISDNICLSTGTSGSNLTTDGGKTWKRIDGTSFNVCRKAKAGKLVLLAGNDGKIAIFKI